MLLIDGTIRTRLDWISELACSSEEFDRLLDKGIFERTRDGSWRLCFVGSLLMVDMLWLSIPKISESKNASNEIDFAHFQKILQALEIYSNRSKARVSGQDDLAILFNASNSATNLLRELEILASIIEWTSSYGFHADEIEHLSSGFDQPIHWLKTFDSNIALHTRTGIIYDSPVCVDVIRKQSAITVMQAFVLLHLLEKYKVITHRLLDNSYDLILEARKILSQWEAALPISLSLLQDFFDETNKDHEKDLLSLLISYVLINESQRENQQSIKLYGTTAFELVWEDMCRYIFQSTPSGPAHLSNPSYYIENDKVAISISKQRPDIIYTIENTTVILDGKYYTAFPLYPPGLEDVRKQFFYSLSLPKDAFSVSGFLFPITNSSHVEYLGHVTMRESKILANENPVEDVRFPRVHCLGIPWALALDSYLERFSLKNLRANILAKIPGISNE